MMDDYEFEKDYWGDCCNTFDEDQKHYVYGRLMGLQQEHYSFVVGRKRILDIGGGPTSMLLKCKDLVKGKVIDPIQYPKWTMMRYLMKNIDIEIIPGEDAVEYGWDEVWIYNCLQHVKDPQKIIENAKEIHCINSSFIHLIDRSSTCGDLFYHKNFYTKPYSNFTLKKSWTIGFFAISNFALGLNDSTGGFS